MAGGCHSGRHGSGSSTRIPLCAPPAGIRPRSRVPLLPALLASPAPGSGHHSPGGRKGSLDDLISAPGILQQRQKREDCAWGRARVWGAKARGLRSWEGGQRRGARAGAPREPGSAPQGPQQPPPSTSQARSPSAGSTQPGSLGRQGQRGQ